jgi:histidinol-phosphate aminotransferase
MSRDRDTFDRPTPEVPRTGMRGDEIAPEAPLRGAREAYRDIPLYRPDLRLAPIALHDNTNRFGVPPAALRVLAEAPLDLVARYPQPYADDLKRALADYAGVADDAIVTGCGSDDVIDSAIRAFSEPGGALAYCDPTFAMAPLFARMNGLAPIAVPLTPELDADAEALLATRADVIYLCSPNNPIGRGLSVDAVERVVAGARGLVILDEAYAEFAERSWIAHAPERARLLVTRTLSKAFGLAGLRIGWGAAAPATAREVEKSRGPFKVGALAVRAALAALDQDREWVRQTVAQLVECRARCIAELTARGFAPLPSEGNFVLVPVPDALAIAQATRESGVAVRPFPGLTRVGDAVRITIGPWSEMEAALGALEKARATIAARTAGSSGGDSGSAMAPSPMRAASGADGSGTASTPAGPRAATAAKRAGR